MREIRHSFKVMTYDIDFAGVVSNQVYIRWLEEAGRAKFVLGAEFVSQASGQVVATAKQTGVFVSVETLRPVSLPDEYRVASDK